MVARKQMCDAAQGLASSIRGIFRAHGIRLVPKCEDPLCFMVGTCMLSWISAKNRLLEDDPRGYLCQAD